MKILVQNSNMELELEHLATPALIAAPSMLNAKNVIQPVALCAMWDIYFTQINYVMLLVRPKHIIIQEFALHAI